MDNGIAVIEIEYVCRRENFRKTVGDCRLANTDQM